MNTVGRNYTRDSLIGPCLLTPVVSGKPEVNFSIVDHSLGKTKPAQ